MPWAIVGAVVGMTSAEQARKVQRLSSGEMLVPADLHKALLEATGSHKASLGVRHAFPKPLDCHGCGAPLERHAYHCLWCKRPT